MAAQEPPGEPPSLPETVRRERENEQAADADAAGSLASTERRGRQEAPAPGDASLPDAERQERAAARDADAEQARSDNPSIPGTEHRQRES